MSEYRLPPRRMGGHLAAVSAFVAAVLLTPVLIAGALPESAPENEPLEIFSEDAGFEFAAAEVACPWDPMAMAEHGWRCDDVAVSYSFHDDLHDPELVLRRALRFAAVTQTLSDAPVSTGGPGSTSLALADAPSASAVLLLRDPAGKEPGGFVITLQGPKEQLTTIAARLWKDATDEALPQEFLEVVDEMPAGPPLAEVMEL